MLCASKKKINAKTTANRACQIPNRGDFRPWGVVVFESVVIKAAFPISDVCNRRAIHGGSAGKTRGCFVAHQVVLVHRNHRGKRISHNYHPRTVLQRNGVMFRVRSWGAATPAIRSTEGINSIRPARHTSLRFYLTLDGK
jgi:hypothetical protein